MANLIPLNCTKYSNLAILRVMKIRLIHNYTFISVHLAIFLDIFLYFYEKYLASVEVEDLSSVDDFVGTR